MQQSGHRIRRAAAHGRVLDGGAAIPDWSGGPALVAASGPSAPAILEALRARMRVLVVNRTFEAAPWADALYAADCGFWAHYAGARAFKGLKLAPDKQCQRYCPDIQLVTIAWEGGKRVNHFVHDPRGLIGGGQHSGFQALNIALQTGAHPVYLAGYDYQPKHWHDDHPQSLRNPDQMQLARWRGFLEAEAQNMAGRVFNLSRESTLHGYEAAECSTLLEKHAALSA